MGDDARRIWWLRNAMNGRKQWGLSEILHVLAQLHDGGSIVGTKRYVNIKLYVDQNSGHKNTYDSSLLELPLTLLARI